jgi:hypothetical protein
MTEKGNREKGDILLFPVRPGMAVRPLVEAKKMNVPFFSEEGDRMP